MSKILNKASLLLNPAGSSIAYKEDKIYSVFPNNGDGDFNFTGGDGGTRVNQDGYIERTPANLHLKSNDFNQSPWSKTGGTTLTSGQSDPFGGDNAWKVEMTSGANNFLYAYSNPRVLGIVTISAYLRADTTTTIGFNDGAVNPNSVTIGTTWQHYTFTYDVGATGPYSIIQLDNYFGLSPTQQAKTFYVYGAQLVEGSIPKPYQPTTDRLNYPRISYTNGRGALLSEPQRTNQLVYSNKFDEGVWAKSNIAGVNANAGISPDGTNNAWSLVPSNVTVGHYMLQNSSVTSGTSYVQTVFAKAKEYQWIQFAPSTGFASTHVNFNLANGTIGTNTTGGTATIEPLRDGWYRCSLVVPSTTTTTGGRVVLAPMSGNQGRLETWTPDGTSGIYIYGAQLEAGLYPSTYIPTTSATVTRPQDVGGKSVPSIVNTSAGTLYLDVVIKGTLSADQFYWGLYDGSGNIIYIGLYNIYGLFRIQNSYALDVNINPVFELNKRYKFALAYQTNDAVAYMNGNSAGNDTSVSIPSVTTMGINFLNENSNIESYTLAYFDSRLSNSQLAELTTVHSGSGGTISYYGPYTIHTFTGSGTFTPSFSGEVEVLVVAGGGSGGVGSNGGGGGGAGGLLHTKSYTVTQGTGIPVVVGSGGARRIGRGSGNNGSNSTFGDLTTLGGGGGGGASAGPSRGKDGGSGGGAQYSSYGGVGRDQQGNGGGDGNYYLGGNHDAGGGGGGAGFAGLDATLSNAGNGGDGLEYSISGFPTYYAGGGGGSSNNASAPQPLYPGEGGLGGGGKGGINGTTLLGTDGIDGLGGGGGAGVGASGGNSGAGGDGIVIVRYLT